MVSAILAARHRTFVLVVTSLFVLFVFLRTINFFFFFFIFSYYINISCYINRRHSTHCRASEDRPD